MVATTKKLGPAGRYGARYGSLARKQVTTVERVQRAKHTCQQCGADAVRRMHTGIWGCRKCNHQFAGGAYMPTTGAGHGSKKTLRGITDKLVRNETDDRESAARVAATMAAQAAEEAAEDVDGEEAE